jgi:hypothetical protein
MENLEKIRRAKCGEIWKNSGYKFWEEDVMIGCCYDDKTTEIIRLNGMNFLHKGVISTLHGDTFVAKNLREYYSIKNRIKRFFKKL